MRMREGGPRANGVMAEWEAGRVVWLMYFVGILDNIIIILDYKNSK